MKREFFEGNRKVMEEAMAENSVLLVYAGHAPFKSGDEYYPFFTNRNFYYLTGITQKENLILLVEKRNEVKETLFILPPDDHAERWTGARIKAHEVEEICGITECKYVEQFDTYFHNLMRTGFYETVYLDLYKSETRVEDTEAFLMAHKCASQYPGIEIRDISRQFRLQRTHKQPCEIEAMRESAKITRAGIVAMMKASKPGMYEYQYKAVWDHALAMRGCLAPGFPSIISAGNNNFCIHYYFYTGQAKDGDMILNDVSAGYDNYMNDVSRGWPCNGKFTEKQKALYMCAYNTSQYMFSIVKPGMAMKDVDLIARKYNFEQLKSIGLLDDYKDIGKYMWHAGAHHVGLDVHDLVEAETVEPGMVFCIDIGIYVEEWGIGFRLEDNLLVTEDGCENLTRDIPRTIEDIEAVMAGEKE